MEPSLEKDSIDRTHTGTRQEGHQERPDELISIDSNDLHGRPQGAQGPARVRFTFPGFRPHTPRVKYLPGGPHLPHIIILFLSLSLSLYIYIYIREGILLWHKK